MFFSQLKKSLLIYRYFYLLVVFFLCTNSYSQSISQLQKKVSKFNMVYEIGDFILVRATEKKKIQGPMDRWLGPYKITACNSMLVTYEEGLKLIEKPYGEIKKYNHEVDCKPGVVLCLGPIVILERGENSVSCRIGDTTEYVYEDDEDEWLWEYFK